MTHDGFISLADEYGFKRVFFLTPPVIDLGGNRYQLVGDARAAYPFASSVAVLVYPYLPFTADERIPAYYLASNAAYHALKAFILRLKEAGLMAERANIPVKLALNAANIGAGLRNSLRALPEYGSRMALVGVAVSELLPLEYSEAAPSPCTGCKRCIAACPAGAIGENGLDVGRCFRAMMDTPCHPDLVRDHQTTFVGCEICQYCCPLNAGLKKTEPTDEMRAAFDIERLIRGDTAAARALVGKNMTGGGRLTAEAIAFAARDGKYAAEIEAAAESEFFAVRDAVRYARKRFSARPV